MLYDGLTSQPLNSRELPTRQVPDALGVAVKAISAPVSSRGPDLCRCCSHSQSCKAITTSVLSQMVHNQQAADEATHGCVSVTIPNQVTQDNTKPFFEEC